MPTSILEPARSAPGHGSSRSELLATGTFALWFAGAAVGHVVVADRYLAAIPPWVPVPEVVNLASVVALVGTVVLLVPERTRYLGALAVLGSLAIFQVAHVDHLLADVAIERVDGEWVRLEGAGERTTLAVRVGAQLVAMAVALWLARRSRRGVR